MGFQHLRKVTAGLVGVAMNHPHYQHYLYRLNDTPQLLLEQRLIKADYRDGGIIGVSQIGDRNSGRFAIHRIVYDPVALGVQQRASDCGNLLY